jgi:ABC-type lipoprotein release transport system permease subunit
MKNYFILGWRNIWRNKRRTLITTASIFFAMFLALVMRSFQIGSYDHMINNAVESYTGYIQIQDVEYWDDKTIDNTFEVSDNLINNIQAHANVKQVSPRLESFALASSGMKTKGVLVLGIDPEKEFSEVKSRLVQFRFTEEAILNLEKENLPAPIINKIKELKNESYSYDGKIELDLELTNGDIDQYMPIIKKASAFNNNFFDETDGVLVADRLAKFLKLNVNDTIVLIGQGYHGISAAGKYPIKGIVKIPNPELDNMLVYMKLNHAQVFYSAENMLTSLALNLENPEFKKVKHTKHQIIKSFENSNDKSFAVKDWKELNTELVQQIESDNGGGIIMIAILYLVVAFGIFGTVLMMTAERRKEFGVMVAVGMKKKKLAIIVTFEMIFLGFLAIISGIIASIPIIQWYHHNPVRLTGEFAKSIENFGMEAVMPMAWQLDIFMNQIVIVMIILLIAIAYPILSITKIKAIQALRD